MNRYKKIIALSIFIAAPAQAGVLDIMKAAFATLWEKPKTSLVLLTLSGFSMYNFYKIYAYKADANRKKEELEKKLEYRLSKSNTHRKDNEKILANRKLKLKNANTTHAKHLAEKAKKQQALADSNVPSTHAQDKQTLDNIQKEITALETETRTLRAETEKLEKQLTEAQMPTNEKKSYTEIVKSLTNIQVVNHHSNNYAAIKKKIEELLNLESSLVTTTKEYLNKKEKTQKSNGDTIKNLIMYHVDCLTNLIKRCTKTIDELDTQYAGNFAYIDDSHEMAYELMGFDWELADQLTYSAVKNKIETLQNEDIKRTLNKLFTDEIAKENYDAYKRGPRAWQALGDNFREQYKKAHDITSKYEFENLANLEPVLNKTKQKLIKLACAIDAKQKEGRIIL